MNKKNTFKILPTIFYITAFLICIITFIMCKYGNIMNYRLLRIIFYCYYAFIIVLFVICFSWRMQYKNDKKKLENILLFQKPVYIISLIIFILLTRFFIWKDVAPNLKVLNTVYSAHQGKNSNEMRTIIQGEPTHEDILIITSQHPIIKDTGLEGTFEYEAYDGIIYSEDTYFNMFYTTDSYLVQYEGKIDISKSTSEQFTDITYYYVYSNDKHQWQIVHFTPKGGCWYSISLLDENYGKSEKVYD